jgi:hypothetical protein
MFQEAIEQLKNVTESTRVFLSVERGEEGKSTTVKAPAVLMMPDFKTPEAFGESMDTRSKVLPLTVTSFIIVSGRTNEEKKVSLSDLEDDCMEKAWTMINAINNAELKIEQEGNPVKEYWEFTDIEWVVRSASKCVLAVEHTLRLQV